MVNHMSRGKLIKKMKRELYARKMKEQRLLSKKIYRVWQMTWILPIVFSALIVFLLSACVFLTIQTITIHDTSAIVPLLSLFILTCFFAYVTLLFFDIPATRLELLDEGVLFSGSGYHLYTPWNNISSIIWTTRSPRFPSVFELKEPAITTLSLDEGRLNNQAILETHWQLPTWLLQNNKEVFVRIPVPVQFFSKKERGDGILDDYLQHYAPHLLS